MWPRSDVAELLGITHPIIQAPMSGFTTPQLVAAVSNAGALGSLGSATLMADALRDQVAQIRQATNRPFNINFFVHPAPAQDADAAERMRLRIAPHFSEFGLGTVPNPSEPFLPFDQERLELIRELRPRVVSFHFGLPSSKATQEVKASGCVVLSSATTVAEAQQLKRAAQMRSSRRGSRQEAIAALSPSLPVPEQSVHWRSCHRSSTQCAFR